MQNRLLILTALSAALILHHDPHVTYCEERIDKLSQGERMVLEAVYATNCGAAINAKEFDKAMMYTEKALELNPNNHIMRSYIHMFH